MFMILPPVLFTMVKHVLHKWHLFNVNVYLGYALTSFGQNNQGETYNLVLPEFLCSYYDCKVNIVLKLEH